jgi:hypothetical protein
MSELFREYTHIVAEPMKKWPYFDIPGCLRKLSWSVGQCYQHITPRWIENDLWVPKTRRHEQPADEPTCYHATVCPENLKRFTDLTFSAIILTLDERTSAPADMLS